MSKHKWSNGKIFKFLGIYEEYDVLWNTEGERCRDRNARDKDMKDDLEKDD